MGFGGGNFSDFDLQNLKSKTVGHWRLNESSGTNAVDSSGNGNDGTTINMEDADWVSGKLNNALRFDGTNEYVNCGDIANFTKCCPFSTSSWVKFTSAATQIIVSRQEVGGGKPGWSILPSGGSINVLIINSTTSNNRIQVQTGRTLNDGLWHHVVTTYDGSETAAGVHMYIDGEDATLVTIYDNLRNDIVNSADCNIGSRDNGSNPFDGDIDDVHIFGRELSQSDVDLLHNSDNGLEV